jgi:aminopeptidase N
MRLFPRKHYFQLLLFYGLLVLVAGQQVSARNDYHDRRKSFSVIKYMINVEVNDTTSVIRGNTELRILLKQPDESIYLDLRSSNGTGPGMVVDSVLRNGSRIAHMHDNHILRLPAGRAGDGDTLNFRVYYGGDVEDGIVISENIYGERTFFADNWPNRAHNWFPCVDHPSFRSKVDLTITAPAHYQVVATGELQRRVSLPSKRTAHYWSTGIPVPVKVMVFGAAPFAVEFRDEIDGIPWSDWVYPQNRENGFNSFSATPEILNFFTSLIGPYPYEKIANVQSTTRYGGMENAGNIFYHENAVASGSCIETLMVHEMAHQWFGNSVSEEDWAHLWLSEGVATWLTDYWVKQKYGEEEYIKRLAGHREKIITYAGERLAPVVDHHPEELTALLNPNTYQKGSWILHMLSRKIGEDKVIEALVTYYNRFKSGYASTSDLIVIFEDISGSELTQFTDDWLYSAGHPVITMNTEFNNRYLNLELVQVQQHKMAFTFPLDIKFVFDDGRELSHTFDIVFRRHEFVIEMPGEPVNIILDPETRLLFELR